MINDDVCFHIIKSKYVKVTKNVCIVPFTTLNQVSHLFERNWIQSGTPLLNIFGVGLVDYKLLFGNFED